MLHHSQLHRKSAGEIECMCKLAPESRNRFFGGGLDDPKVKQQAITSIDVG